MYILIKVWKNYINCKSYGLRHESEKCETSQILRTVNRLVSGNCSMNLDR